jgi:hypothetical protein
VEVEMKKIVIAVVFAAILAAGSPLFAQQNSREGQESDYYYINISLEKIFPYRAGYIVQYRKGGTVGRIATTYLPIEWFTYAGGKAEIVKLPRGRGWPSMSVYYKDGEFSHVRLYVHAMHSHSTWGNVPQTVNVDDRFQNVDTIQLEF